MNKRNRIRCLYCDEVIESKHRHDYKSCSCGKTAVDGGTDYMRVVGDLHMIRLVNDDDTEENVI